MNDIEIHPWEFFPQSGKGKKLIIGSFPPKRFTNPQNLQDGDVDFFYGSIDNRFWDLFCEAKNLEVNWRINPELLKQYLMDNNWIVSDIVFKTKRRKNTALDKDAFYMNLFDAARDLSGTDTYYAFPYALVTTCLFYNMDMFDEAGLTYPNSDWTWNDFLKAAKALTKDTNKDGTIDQWGYFFYGRYAHVESWVYANDGYLIDRASMRFEPDANGMAALKFLTDLVLVEKVAPPFKECLSMALGIWIIIESSQAIPYDGALRSCRLVLLEKAN